MKTNHLATLPQVVAVEICRDSLGNSRGFGSVIFSHPLEAVQAISMLNNQSVRTVVKVYLH
jgi:hypothetical protein